jgi:hypothetical protein
VNQRDDTEGKPAVKATAGPAGRNVIAVIGIDRYDHWPPLSNAVRDATGAAARLGGSGSRKSPRRCSMTRRRARRSRRW